MVAIPKTNDYTNVASLFCVIPVMQADLALIE